MTVQIYLPLLELAMGNFSYAWTQFRLLAAAKHVDEAKHSKEVISFERTRSNRGNMQDVLTSKVFVSYILTLLLCVRSKLITSLLCTIA